MIIRQTRVYTVKLMAPTVICVEMHILRIIYFLLADNHHLPVGKFNRFLLIVLNVRYEKAEFENMRAVSLGFAVYSSYFRRRNEVML